VIYVGLVVTKLDILFVRLSQTKKMIVDVTLFLKEKLLNMNMGAKMPKTMA